ncbi:MAG TPA: DctP family TRAP transporter solute-binding subunit [Thioploca sp.]|nr:MAG: C4-dicarboxylate ABC transporter [Gammaproteobacteria bacterium]HDN27695.1 DctP family TRAP transporter solute-binding subunit [Thioploca sp.]
MRILIIGLVLLLLSACCKLEDEPTTEDKRTKIIFSHVVGKDTPKGIGANMFKRLVRERLGEQVVVEVYPNSLLYNDNDVMEVLKSGKVQLAAPSLSKLAKYHRTWQVFDLPFLFEDIDAVDRFQESQKGKELLTSLQTDGYVSLAYWHNGMKQLSANQSLQKPDDVKGLTFRIQKENANDAKKPKPLSVLQAQFTALNAKTEPMAFSKVYKALQDKNIDGQENTWSNSYSEKYHKVQNHFSQTNHGYLGYLLIANTDLWKGLDNEVRDELTKIIKEVTAEVNELANKLDESSRQEIEKKAELFFPDKDEREEWCKAIWHEEMQSDWKRIVNDIGSDILEAAKKANENQERCPFTTISSILSESSNE